MIEVIAEADLTAEQTEFAAFWTHKYFGHVSACQNRDQANVHWRMFVRDNGELVSHLSLTELAVQLDDSVLNAGSIGSVFTVKSRLGEGFANQLMDYAEDFLLQQSEFPLAILFCLPELVPFYQQRDWQTVTVPVTLEQTSREVLTWGEECMILDRRTEPVSFERLHVPIVTDR